METSQLDPAHMRLTRRAACDRCRTQKLRCVRVSLSDSAKCKRCENAGTSCHYSISKPAGRPPVNGSSSTASSSGQGKGLSEPGPQVRSLQRSSQGDNPAEPGRVPLAPSVMGNGEEQPESRAVGQQVDPFGPHSMAWSPGHDDLASLPSTNGWPTTQSPVIASVPRTPTATLPGFPEEEADWSSTLHAHDPVDAFSELNMRLYQSATVGSTLERDVNRPGKLLPFPTQFAGRVIDISSAFLALLKAIGGQRHRFGEPHANHLFWNGELLRDQHMRFTDRSSESSDDDSGGPRLEGDGHRFRRDANKLWKTSPPLADITTLLQLLACYLRLRQLHNILYTAIHQYMTTIPAEPRTAPYQGFHSPSRTDAMLEETGTRPPLFKDLQIGGVSLEDFHPFQVKFVLQIVVHILGEIEFSLGLPAAYRVSKELDDEEPGILGSSISPQLLKTVMQDQTSSFGRVGGESSIVLAMRERLSQLRKLLRGSINL
ncbi:Zn(II)2Cys6 transcription factor domain-containing protein [Aspergillus clavatus NRRL 1]|uniref:C6 zinc finger domain protein n=1 Tax=Aspergillus clavatus (strain ATCC 1007 / CBS 513.65 / DSM 816 / NCTC 3887 / NRRL 1 / QM 1276 / 107) TaxID=344612 RepID=A1CUT6_ASPCL|nr:C6 zinc finger domain protein [Aspergillus clavatus NRRL 1]EAW07073.1 C6 zinc finger domain protein [Aspergillus clavatus NRRL 1]